MKQLFVDKAFRPATLRQIEIVNAIIEDYSDQGFDLTLRQLYYQMVARAYIENSERSYKNFGKIVNDGRLAGLIDWDAIVDRTRNLRQNGHWNGPQDIMRSVVNSFAIDKWDSQPTRVEVWIEKDALVGVIADICNRLDVPYFSCRGYTSQSEMYAAGQRMAAYQERGQNTVILHLGDHDPSGIDMTRDIEARMYMFVGDVEVQRLALNWDQIEQYNPPPNFAKLTDSRASDYVANFGKSSWELDALDPSTLSDLIDVAVSKYRDEYSWEVAVAREEEFRRQLQIVRQRWPSVVDMLSKEGKT